MAGSGMVQNLLLMYVCLITVYSEDQWPFRVHLESNTTVANAGEHVKFICTATDHKPYSDLYYYRTRANSTTPTKVDSDYKMSKADNQAKFHCEAQVPGYPDMKKSSNTITTTVKFDATRIDMTEKPLNSVKIGERVTLKCRTDSSSPGATVEWFKTRQGRLVPQQIYTPINSKQDKADFGTVQESEHYFLASKEDGGATYTCEIKGTGIQSSVMINVTFPNTNTRTEFKDNHTTAAPLGSERILVCETDESNPPVVLKWFELTGQNGADPSWHEVKDNITSSSNATHQYGGMMTVSSLTLKATKEVNNRKYKCISVYSSGNYSIVRNSSISTMKVKWKAKKVNMTRPQHPTKAGDTVKMKCETSSSQYGPPGKFAWFINGQPIPTRVSISESSSVRDGVDHYVSILEFEATKEDNQARFECRIDDNETMSEVTTLQVLFPPKGIEQSDSLTSWEGEQKTLSCKTTSSSNPAVVLSIKKGAKELAITPEVTGGDNDGYDVKAEALVDTTRSDNGAQYLCTATYMNSTTFAKSVQNNVKFNPTNISIIKKPTGPIHAGETIGITCETDSANPAAQALFQCRGKGYGSWEFIAFENLRETERGGQYNGKIRTIQVRVVAGRHDNGKEFRCLVSDPAHDFEVEEKIRVEVFYPPELVIRPKNSRLKEGATLNLDCTAFAGHPNTYTCTWYHNGIPIPSARGCTYRVEKVSYKQGGTYRCEVRNYSPGGVVSGNANIDVQFKPRWNPQYPKIMSVPAVVNQSVKFDLCVIANPSPTSVTWSRQTRGKPTLDLNGKAANATLKVLVTGYSDLGNYTATVTNEIGVTHFVFTLENYAATTSIPVVTSSMKITEANTFGNNETSAGFMITARLENVFVLFAAHLAVYTFFYYENLQK